MSVISSYSKGRASNYLYNSACREAAAITIACNLQLVFRWIPSEYNTADYPPQQF